MYVLSWQIVYALDFDRVLFHCLKSEHHAEHMFQWIRSALVQIMACRLFGAKPLSKPMVGYCQLDPQEQTSVKL